VLAAGVSVLVRFHRARGAERQQIKWLLFAVVTVIVGYPLLDLARYALGHNSEATADASISVLLSCVPLAVGLAILRYRLYDIDRLINRTLVYGLLTAILGLVYAGAVLVLGDLFGGIGAKPPSWVVPVSPWPWPPCSGRPAAASRRRWTGASTGAATTRPRPSRRTAPDSAMRSTWIPSPPSCWQWLTRPWSQPGSRSGCDPPHPFPWAQLAVRHGLLPGPTEHAIRHAPPLSLVELATGPGSLSSWSPSPTAGSARVRRL